jgi:cold shock protein
MLRSQRILLYGRDALLLRTRGLILRMDGWETDSVPALDEVKACLAKRRYALLVLCHSLAESERRAGVALAASFTPAVKMLALEVIRLPSRSHSFAHVLNTSEGPAGFRNTVQSLVEQAHDLTRPTKRKVDMAQFEGTVRWFNNSKGYGFLGRSGGSPDVFIHYTAIQRDGYKTLKEGDPVSFDVVQREKGSQTNQVVVLSKKK